ncbi:zinc transporter ZntB [Hirschia litorea]|uniref:Zinc transporter ZntB n=1 Tax=Hirschia litorea TaxID=1199156 RepID=A0ABW2IGY3_9PROT
MMSGAQAVEPIYAFDVHKDGRVEKLTSLQVVEPHNPDIAYRWVHLDLAHGGTREWIRHHVDDVVARSLTLEDTRPRSARHDDGILLNLRGVNLNPESNPEDMVSIRMWVEKNLVVSVRLRRLMAVVGIREAVESGNPPRTVGCFITDLAAALTERMDPVIGGLSDKVDEMEEMSLVEPEGLRTSLAKLRRTTIMLRRHIGPQREALSKLTSDGLSILDEAQQITLRETLDRITRMVEELDAVRERSAILYDQLSDQRGEEMNRNMLVLSVVAAIFLPLGFLTGLLGVNIGGIPGADNPFAFAAFCVLLAVISLGLMLWFRKKNWI